MNDRIATILVAVLVGVGLVTYFLLTHERVDEDVYTRPRGEAAYNPVLAVQRLLTRLGYDARSEIEFAPTLSLPSIEDTAVVLFDYRRLDETDLELLLDWVSRGGHLLVQIYPKYHRSFDPIFTPLGIDVEIPDDDGVDELIETLTDGAFESEAEAKSEEPASDPAAPPEHLAERSYWGDLSSNNRHYIDFGDNETIWTVADEDGMFAGQIGFDEGILTVVADLRFVTNRQVGQDDNAFILTRLLGTPATAGHIWIFYGRDFPSLLQLVWGKASLLFKVGALLLVLLIWWQAQRFGPDIPAPPTARKAFLDHIRASGRFLWGAQEQEALLHKTQRAFLRDYERRHPGARQHGRAQRNQHLADLCDMPAEKVDNALGDAHGRGHHEFVQKMHLLKSLWKKI